MATREEELMDPAASPSRVKPRMGVRRLNGRPLILLVVVLAGFLAVMAKTAIDRKDRQVLVSRSQEDQGGDSTMFAQAVAGAARPGYLPAALPPPPVVPVTKEELDLPPPPPPLPALVSRGAPPQVVSRDTEGERIRQLKFAAMLSAARAPTSGIVSAGGLGSGLDSGSSPFGAEGAGFGARPTAPSGPGSGSGMAESLARARRDGQELRGVRGARDAGYPRESLANATAVLAASMGIPPDVRGAAQASARFAGAGSSDGVAPGLGAEPLRLAGSERDADNAPWDQWSDPRSDAQTDPRTDPQSRASLDRWDHPMPQRDRWRLPSQVQAPRTPFEIRAGAVLPAILVSGINSDLAGPILAQVSQNVYDTPTGRHLLIPQGTKLLGRYANEIAYGQSRVLIAWQRLTFPNGTALDIGAMPGADEAGQAGFADRVDHHYLRLFGNALLLSAITGGIALSQRDGSPNAAGFGAGRSASDVMSQQLGIVLGQTIAAVIRRNLNISPTIAIRPGYRFNVIATRDITLDAPYPSHGSVLGAQGGTTR